MKTIADFCHAGQNSFGLIRLCAAMAVVFSHAYVIIGGPQTLQPLEAWTGYPLGAHAVHVFFTVSGLLVAASFERRPNIVAFGAARIFRIYPGLIVATCIVFLTCATIASTADLQTIVEGSLFGYFVKTLIGLAGSGAIPGVFENLPEAGVVNAPLWTLKYEVMSYIGLGIVAACVAKVRSITMAQASTFIIVLSALWLANGKAYNDAHFFDHLARFSFAFWCGVLAWQLKDKIVIRWEFVMAGFATTALMIFVGSPLVPHCLMLLSGYLALFAAQYHYGPVTEFTDKNDLSYGVYIFGWPIQQLLLVFGLGSTPLINAFLALTIALPLAFLSWRLVEKPALRWKDRFA